MGRVSLKEIRQKEIIKAFYEVSKKIGLENASIAKVADAMDINPSLIVHYFNSREALLEGLIRFILEQYSAIYETDGKAYETTTDLKLLIDNLFSRKWNTLFDDSVFYSCYALTYRDKKLRTAFLNLHDSLRKSLFHALQKAKKKGVISIKKEKETSDVIFALLEGGYYYLGMTDSIKDQKIKMNALRKQAYQILDLR